MSVGLVLDQLVREVRGLRKAMEALAPYKVCPHEWVQTSAQSPWDTRCCRICSSEQQRFAGGEWMFSDLSGDLDVQRRRRSGAQGRDADGRGSHQRGGHAAVSIHDALVLIGEAKRLEEIVDLWSTNPEVNLQQRRRREELALGMRMEAVVLAIAAQLEKT